MSLQPARLNFTIYEGATFYKRITYSINGAVQDLSGFDARLVIKDTPEGTTLMTLDTQNGIDLGGVDGTIDLSIDASDTATLAWSSAVYELFITDTHPHTDVLLYGGIKVHRF